MVNENNRRGLYYNRFHLARLGLWFLIRWVGWFWFLTLDAADAFRQQGSLLAALTLAFGGLLSSLFSSDAADAFFPVPLRPRTVPILLLFTTTSRPSPIDELDWNGKRHLSDCGIVGVFAFVSFFRPVVINAAGSAEALADGPDGGLLMLWLWCGWQF